MIFDFNMISSFYRELPDRIASVREKAGRPLTLTEKILWSHLYDRESSADFKRGRDYVLFAPDRVAMQDATAQMALLQFMVTGKDETAVPATVHCDHLITAESGAVADLLKAMNSNREVYDFLSSVSSRYNMGFWKPGAGIIHQIILENYAFPGGMMIGTDSHTPNAGGLGMIGIGVGGADAVDVMTGMGWELKLPKIIGVKLSGRMSGWTSAKDVILKLAGILTVKGGTGAVIEYFGDGASAISCTGKATICNMGAETGATCSLFQFDDSMAEYLNATGRSEVAGLALANRSHLCADPEVLLNPSDYYDQFIEIDLDKLEPHINGPFTPDRAVPVSRMKEEAEKNGWPVDVQEALIGSCTNSSYEDLSRAASIVKDALSKNLRAKAGFKVTPGSELIYSIASREGFTDLFIEFGAEIFANACGPCIGQWNRKNSDNNEVNTIIHSFNRNFSKRADGNPNTHAFVASPEIVTAIAVAGKLTFNPITDTLVNDKGETVRLAEPQGAGLPAGGFLAATVGYQKPAGGDNINEIRIDPASERLQLLEPFRPWEGTDLTGLPLLIKAKGKCTTDHISMAGFWLRYRGHLEKISDNYMIGAINWFNDQANRVLNRLTGDYGQVPVVARAYRDSLTGSVVAGEENFGEGSSREHAAMEPRFLGVRAVIVKSFARIHETNLKKQGVLTLTFADPSDYDLIREDDIIDITGLEKFAPGNQLTLILNHSDGSTDSIAANHSYNSSQIEWFKAGSALNLMKNK